MKNYFTLSWGNTFVFLGIYFWYVGSIFLGDVTTNIATWLIFSISAWINAFSYHFSSGKDLEISRIYFASATMCAAIAGASFFTGHFSPIGVVEWFVLIVSALTLFIWFVVSRLHGNGAIIAQLINIGVVAVGFVPLWVAQARGLADENWLLWALWCGTLLVQCFLVVRKWKNHWIEIIGPVSYLWFHVFVVLLDFV